MLDLIDGSRAAELGYVDPAGFRSAYEAYVAGGHMRHDLWWPLTLELWLRKYVSP